MSEWFDVTDQDDVDLSDDGKEVHILFATNRNGNRYVSVPVDILVKLLAAQQSVQADLANESEVEIDPVVMALRNLGSAIAPPSR